MRRDPLCERVHHTKPELIPLLMGATMRFVGTRLAREKGR
jgi:hypothetical protein